MHKAALSSNNSTTIYTELVLFWYTKHKCINQFS